MIDYMIFYEKSLRLLDSSIMYACHLVKSRKLTAVFQDHGTGTCGNRCVCKKITDITAFVKDHGLLSGSVSISWHL